MIKRWKDYNQIQFIMRKIYLYGNWKMECHLVNCFNFFKYKRYSKKLIKYIKITVNNRIDK